MHLLFGLILLPLVVTSQLPSVIDGFTWYFTWMNVSDSADGTQEITFLACADAVFEVENVPSWPIHMMAISAPGYPITNSYEEGDDLSFQIAFSPGTELNFFLFDSSWDLSPSNGGLTWEVLGSGNETADSSCQAQDHSSAPGFSLNATQSGDLLSLGACDVLGIEITGGTPPYTVSMVQYNQTNNQIALNLLEMTLPVEDNYLAWANTLTWDGIGNSSDGFIEIAVRDSNFGFAPTSEYIQLTYVPESTTCSTRTSSFSTSGTASTTYFPSPSASSIVESSTSASSSKNNHLAAILAPILSVWFVAGLVILAWTYMKKQRRMRLVSNNAWKGRLERLWKDRELRGSEEVGLGNRGYSSMEEGEDKHI